MQKWTKALLLLLGTCVGGLQPLTAQQARQMARSTTGFGDSSLVITSDTLTSKTTFVTKAVSLAQMRKSLSKFAFDSLSVTNAARFAGDVVITRANSANSFVVGRQGLTNPGFRVSSSSVSTTGILLTPHAAGSGMDLGVISSGSNENLNIDALGTGTITLNGTATGGVVVSRALTYGGVALNNAVTGTGNMVLSAGPTFTGTVTSGAMNLSGSLTATTATFTNAVNITTSAVGTLLILDAGGTSYNAIRFNQGGSSHGFLGPDYSQAITNTSTNGDLILRFDGSNLRFSASATTIGTMTAAGALTLSAGITATTGTFSALASEGSTQNAVCITAAGVLQQNAAASCLVSARRFKHDINSLSTAEANRIGSLLRPVSYAENTTNQKRIGLIAEEADSVDHRLASRDAKGLITSVNYEEVTIISLKMLQDLQARVAALEKRKP